MNKKIFRILILSILVFGLTGSGSGVNNTTGNENSFFGHDSGVNNTTGSFNSS